MLLLYYEIWNEVLNEIVIPLLNLVAKHLQCLIVFVLLQALANSSLGMSGCKVRVVSNDNMFSGHFHTLQ